MISLWSLGGIMVLLLAQLIATILLMIDLQNYTSAILQGLASIRDKIHSPPDWEDPEQFTQLDEIIELLKKIESKAN